MYCDPETKHSISHVKGPAVGCKAKVLDGDRRTDSPSGESRHLVWGEGHEAPKAPSGGGV